MCQRNPRKSSQFDENPREVVDRIAQLNYRLALILEAMSNGQRLPCPAYRVVALLVTWLPLAQQAHTQLMAAIKPTKRSIRLGRTAETGLAPHTHLLITPSEHCLDPWILEHLPRFERLGVCADHQAADGIAECLAEHCPGGWAICRGVGGEAHGAAEGVAATVDRFVDPLREEVVRVGREVLQLRQRRQDREQSA